MSALRVGEGQARAFAARLLEAAGAGAGDADVVARSLVVAERAGHAGHGLSRLPGYVGRLRAGGTVSGPWRLVAATGPVESYDGAAGLGHVHLELAAERAAALCAEHGIGVVGVSRSNHAGALGTRARALAERGLVALMLTNAPAVLAPPGGVRAVVGTNPIALALAVEVLTGALLGPAVGPEVVDFFGDDLSRPQGVAHLVLALRPSAFGAEAAFAARMARLCEAVLEAGEPGATRLPGARAAEHDGSLTLGPGIAATLHSLAAELGVDPIVPDP